jgi:type I restriction enzyme S subunit
MGINNIEIIYKNIEAICFKPEYGFTTKAAKNGKIKLLRTTDITSGKIDWDKVPYCSKEPLDKEKYILKSGDILVSRAGSVGVSILLKNPYRSIFASYLIRLRTLINSKYLKYFLDSPFYWRLINEQKAGIAVSNINATKLKNIKVPIYPLPEQHEIVRRLEAQFSRLDDATEKLKTARQQLKTYRQAVLKQAFDGELTKEWRAKQGKNAIHGVPGLEPAEKLLEKIKAERQKRYDEQVEEWKKAVKQWEADGKPGKKPKKPQKPKELNKIAHFNIDNLPILPKNWKWTKLSEFTNKVEYGTSQKSKPKGRIPVLRMGNIQNNHFDWSDLVYTDDENEIKKYTLKKYDVLFNRTNSPELVGKSAIFLNERQAIFAGYLIRINHFKNLIHSKYLNYYLNSYEAKKYGNSVKTDGVNQSNINGEKLMSYPFPLTSEEEQTQIVHEIEKRFSVAEKLEKTIEESLQKAEALRQSILKKAFEGELTRKWREENPELITGENSAEKLLERIKKEKEQLNKK